MRRRWLGALGEVRRGEAAFTLLMFLYFFLVIASFWILKPLKKSIFVQFYDQRGLQWLGTQLDAAQAELLAKVLNMVVAAAAAAVFGILAKRDPQLLVHGDHSTGPALARCVFQMDGLACLTSGIGDHSPSQAGYLLGPQAGFDRQEEDDPVPGGPSGLC